MKSQLNNFLITNLENDIHNLRESFINKEKESNSEASQIQNAIMDENKVYRERIKVVTNLYIHKCSQFRNDKTAKFRTLFFILL